MFLKYTVGVPSFKSIISSFYQETYDEGNFTPTPRQKLPDQNTSVGKELTELI